MHGDERLDLGDEAGVASASEVHIDPVLERGEVRPLEPCDLGMGKRLVPEVGQRSPAPQAERGLEEWSRLVRRPPRGVRDEPLEPARVELVDTDAHEVPGRPRDEHAFAEHLPQLRDVALDHLHRRRRWLLAPERLAQAIDRNRLVRVEEQNREQCALLRAGERKHSIAVDDLEWAEDAVLQPHSARR